MTERLITGRFRGSLKRRPQALEGLQERLGVKFRDESHLVAALRHRSAALDGPQGSNERLEFLGDSIVGMVICDYLYSQFPESSEGDLAKAKAFLASEPILAASGHALGLDPAIELSAGEDAAGGRLRPSILADTFEAVVASVYMDQGMRAARRLVMRALKPAMQAVARDEHHHDYKSQLQERLQASMRKTPHYRILSQTGADHDKTFVAQAVVGRKVIGEGVGKSKKQAEQAAALDALGKV